MKKSCCRIYSFVSNNYELVKANERNHFPLPQLGIELGICQGIYHNMELPWLRCWDSQGNLLLTGEERAKILAEKLRQMGINPDEE